MLAKTTWVLLTLSFNLSWEPTQMQFATEKACLIETLSWERTHQQVASCILTLQEMAMKPKAIQWISTPL